MKRAWQAIAISTLVVFFSCELLLAETPSVTAVLTSSEAAVGQTVQLQIKVTGTRSASPPQEINVDGLEIHSTGETRSFEMRNFDVRSSVVFNYTILPMRAGRFKIPSQAVQAEGKSVRTPELTLNVTGSSGGSSARAGRATEAVDPAKFGFVELILTKPSAYVGEMIPVEVRVGFNVRVRVEALGAGVSINGQGFTTQKMPDARQTVETINGNTYQVLTFKTAIAAARTGKIDIGPAEITPVVRISQPGTRSPRMPRDLFDMNDPFFDNFFNDPMFAPTIRKEITLRSEPATLDVKPLPPNAPQNFSGAVGIFTMTADAKPKTAGVGDPVTVTADISGRGSFDRVTAPSIEDERGWHKYPPSAKFKQDDDVGISGTKSFDAVLTPNEPKSTIPRLLFSYFDPIKENYVTLRSDPIPVRVEGGTVPAPTAAGGPAVTAAPSAIAATTPKPADILYQLTERPARPQSFTPLFARRIFWIAQIFPLLALIGFIGWKIRTTHLGNRDAQYRAALQAEMAELQRKLRRGDGSPGQYFAEASRAVQLKTALAKNISPAAVDADMAAAVFKLDRTGREQLRRLFERSDELRYSGNQNGSETISPESWREIVDLIENLQA
jgi:hypothetical protein